MADILLNKLINEEVKLDLFIKWLLDVNTQQRYFNQFKDCKCTQTDFLTYFLNFVHEEIPCQNKNDDQDLPLKDTSRQIELVGSEEKPPLCSKLIKTDMCKSVSFPLSLSKTLEKSETSFDDVRVDVIRNTSTPKISKVQSDYNLTNGYVSPISPLYKNQNSFTMPRCKQQLVTLRSTEKVSPLCLGDFIINTRSSGKKKATRNLIGKGLMDESSKRIKPTCLNQVKINSGFRKTENSFNNFQNSKEVSMDDLNENRTFLAEERLKILSRKNSAEDNLPIVASKKINNLNFKVLREPDINFISNKAQLDSVIEVYVCILKNNLVLNITSEIYFLISLLISKQFDFKDGRENVSANSSEDSYLGVELLNEDKSEVSCSDCFKTIHNVTYFAARCLESQIDVLRYYDKSTLKLLSQNNRLRSFANSFAEKLAKISDKKAERVLELAENDVQTNICFNLDTDNRENFPNDFSFHAFRKQRDLFYEILRIWETNRLLSGWNFAISLGGKIKSLLGLQNEPANFMHFCRLFKAQLLSTCGKSQKEEGLTENQMPFLSSLANVDADKLKRLKNRLVTKQSSNGINSVPSFTGHQEFYKDFIVIAGNFAFNKHLCDTLIAEIVELNENKFTSDLEETDGVVDPSTRKAYLACLKSLRVLAKFLGFIECLPYKSECVNYSENLLATHKDVRRQTIPSLNIKQLLVDSIEHKAVVLTIPWLTKYLSMLDYVTLRLPYYVSVYRILFDMYKNWETSAKGCKTVHSYNISLVRFCLGWLFELPHFPDSEYFHFCTNKIQMDKTQTTKCKNIKNKSLDDLAIVDQNILYVCCPYLQEIKTLLSNNAQNSSVTVKHITPVTAVQSSKEIAMKRTEQQLEEAFFNGQPISVKKTVEFVSERVASTCVKHICYTIVPSFKKTALENLRDFLATWKKEQDGMLPTEEKSHKGSLRALSNQMMHTNLRSLIDSCEKEVYGLMKEKILASIDGLLSIDMLAQTKGVCAALATKMCAERVRQWITSHVTLSIFTKDFDFEVQRVLFPENRRVVREKAVFALPSGGSAKTHNDNSTSAFHLLEKIKELAIEILESSTNVTKDNMLSLLEESYVTLTERCDVNDYITNITCSLLFDVSLLLITHKPHVMAYMEVREKFVRVWKCYCGKTEDLFRNLLSLRNVMVFSQSCDETTVWRHYASFVAFLIGEEMLTCDDFESQCTGFFKRDWDKDSLENVTTFLCAFVDCYKSNGGSIDKFILLLEFLSEFCTDL